MADSENTTTKARPRYHDLIEELRAAGVDYALTIKVFECVEAERAEAIAKAARLYHFDDDEDKINPGYFSDELCTMSRRMWGIVAAVTDVLGDRSDKVGPGVVQIVEDAAREMERLAEAFHAENWLVRHPGAQS
jgi:hypothetical protein